jgi:hypothetical protein
MPRSSTPTGDSRIGSSVPKAVRVFVSYSHDSPSHKQRVFRFAEQLREDGIDCELDQYEEAPPEGWPSWMAKQVRQAKYVLVVCTATYHRRVIGTERLGVGLGARWEGALITQDLYERGGQNDKFIPVLFESNDLKEIPDFLRHTTYYDLSDAGQEEKLYRRLTDQPRVVRRPIGPVRRLPKDREGESGFAPVAPVLKTRSTGASKKATNPSGNARGSERERTANSMRVSGSAASIALIREPTGPSYFIPLLSAEVRGEETTAVLQPASGQDRAFLENLANRRFGLPTVDFSFGTTAMRSRLNSVVRTFEDGKDRFTLVLSADAQHQGSMMEMATNGVSADDIARLRARRILLAETLPAPSGHASRGFGEEGMLETLVRGLHAPVSVEHSPLPVLFRSIGATNKSHFLAAAKLTAVLWLRLSGTVAHVFELEMKFKGANALTVRFRGARNRVYTNREPEIITVDGVCSLG